MTGTDCDIWADGSVDIQGANREYGLRRSRAYELMGSGRLPYSVSTGRRLIPRRAIMRLLAEGMVGTVETDAAK